MRTKPSPDFGGPALRPAKRDNVTLDGLITLTRTEKECV
jgi:hypothetical protein